MSEYLQNQLNRKIDELKSFISEFDTESVLGAIANDLTLLHDGKNLFSDTKLTSPYKQYMYLAGIILSTDELNNKQYSEKDSKKVKKLLEEICNIYALSFFPNSNDEKQELGKLWYEARKISMPVFLDYFNTAILNYEEQQIDRVKRWFAPYIQFFKENYKFSVDELLEIYDFIITYLRNTISNINELKDEIEVSRDKWLKHIENDEMSFSQARDMLDIEYLRNVYENILLETNKLYHIPINELTNKFGESTINGFLEQFSITRFSRDYKYYTENNPFENKPLWRKNQDYIFCPVYKQLLNAIFYFLYNEMEKSKTKQSFYEHRDEEAENQTLELFNKLFGDEARYFNSVFERNDSQNEHDLLIIYKDKIIIVEVKASKLKEPFRDPDKAYVRIKRDFKSDSGIQKAYNQGLSLKKYITANGTSILFDKKGKLILSLNRDDYNDIYIFCVTAENYGILSSQLSYLLEKPHNEPYPWACNLYDLENIVDAFKFKKYDAEHFLNYINDRIKYHERLIATDELEICGYYLREGSMDKLEIKNKSMMFFSPDMSDIFDEIYFKKKGLDIKYSQYNPNIVDMEQLFSGVNNNKNIKNSKKQNKKKNKTKMIKKSKINNRKK